jgi:hypothetical protein
VQAFALMRVWLLGAGLMLAACSGNEDSAGSGGAGGSLIVDGSAGDGGHSHGGGDGGIEAPPFTGPENLGDTGLYSDFATKTPTSGLIEYDVRFPLWSDGAEKKRYLQLPPGTKIDTSWMDVWQFPVETKAWMEFTLGDKLIETRFSHKRDDGWMMVSYLWNEAGTDAVAVPNGGKSVLGTAYNVPSQAECMDCHFGVGDGLWGVSAIQLSGETGDGWLSKLAAQELLTDPPPAGEEFPVPGDGVVEQAIGYLHSNCGQCHNNQHYLASKRALRLKLSVSAKLPEETALYTTAIGGQMNHIVDGTTIAVVPGKPAESQLWQRMNRRGDLMEMPAIVTNQVDTAAVQTIGEWITGLAQ